MHAVTETTTTIEGYEAIRLRSPSADLEATFVPRAGMLGASLRDAGVELLGRRFGVRRYAEDGKTMGIPLLHPWANRLARDEYTIAGRSVRLAPGEPLVQRDEHGLPIHGLMGGARHWRARGDGASLRAELDYGAHPDLLAIFPFPHALALDVAVRDRILTVRTTLTATGDVAVPVAFGFHPYLKLADVARADWEVALPAMTRLEHDARSIPTGASTPSPAWSDRLGERTFDDGYSGLEPGASFAVSGGGRRITVRLDEGFPDAQVFAPSSDDVVCFEPMTAPANALVTGDLELVPPGESYSATFSISVEDA
jgi:aldose 1-epimerase